MMPQPLLPSLPDAQAILIRLSVVCLVLPLVGCGGGGWSSDKVEDDFRQSYPQLSSEWSGASISDVTCSKNQGNEYSCGVDLATTDGPMSLVVSAVCEDKCVWRSGG